MISTEEADGVLAVLEAAPDKAKLAVYEIGFDAVIVVRGRRLSKRVIDEARRIVKAASRPQETSDE